MRRASWIRTLTIFLAGASALGAGSAYAASAAPAGGPAPAPVVPLAPAVTSPAATSPAATSPAATSPAATTTAPASQPTATSRGLIRDPAPRPIPALRVQSRYTEKAGRALVYAGVDYLSRGDFFNSPGARIGAAFYLIESVALEAQISHYWSWLNDEGQRVRDTLGAVPDSHAPEWLMLAGARYSIGYGKLLVGGMGTAIHFEPQIFAHLGGHLYDGDSGFSSDAGLGLLVFLTPRAFARIDVAMVFERERRSGVDVSVLGALPALCFGGVL